MTQPQEVIDLSSKFIAGVDVEFDYSKQDSADHTAQSPNKKSKKTKRRIKLKSSGDMDQLDQYPQSRVIKQGKDGDLEVSPLNESEEYVYHDEDGDLDDREDDADDHHHHMCSHDEEEHDHDHHHHHHYQHQHQHQHQQHQHQHQHHHHDHDHDHAHDCQHGSSSKQHHQHTNTTKRLPNNKRGGKHSVSIDSEISEKWVPSSPEEQQELQKFWHSISMADKQKLLAVDKCEVFAIMERERKTPCSCKSCARENYIVNRIVHEIFLDYDSTFGNVIIAKFLEDKELMATLLKEQKAKRELQQQEYLKLEKQLKLEQLKKLEQDKASSPPSQLQLPAPLDGATTNPNFLSVLEEAMTTSDESKAEEAVSTPISDTDMENLCGVPETEILSVAQDLLKTDGKYFLEIMERLETNPALKAIDISRQISHVLGILNKGVFGQPNPDLTAIESVLSEFRHWESQKSQSQAQIEGTSAYNRDPASLDFADEVYVDEDDADHPDVDIDEGEEEYEFDDGDDVEEIGEVEDEEQEEEDDDENDDEEDYEGEYEDDEEDRYDEIDEEKLSAEATRDTYSRIQSISFKIVHSRLVSAYKEKAAEDSTRQLIEELEAEERRKKEKEEKKQRQKEKLKEKKRQQQLLKEEEKRKKEEAKAEQERLLKEEQQRKMEEGRKKKEEQRKKKDEEKKKKLEALKRKEQEAERQRKEKEEKERQRIEEKRLREEGLKLQKEEQERIAEEKLEQERLAQEAAVAAKAEVKSSPPVQATNSQSAVHALNSQATASPMLDARSLAPNTLPPPGLMRPPTASSGSLPQDISDILKQAMEMQQAQQQPHLMSQLPQVPQSQPQVPVQGSTNSSGISPWDSRASFSLADPNGSDLMHHQQMPVPPSNPNGLLGYRPSAYGNAPQKSFSPFSSAVPLVDSRHASDLDVAGLDQYMSSMGLGDHQDVTASTGTTGGSGSTPTMAGGANLWQNGTTAGNASLLLSNNVNKGASIWGQSPRFSSYNHNSSGTVGNNVSSVNSVSSVNGLGVTGAANGVNGALGSLWSTTSQTANLTSTANGYHQQISYGDAELIQIAAFKSSSINLVNEPGAITPTSALLVYTKSLLPSMPGLSLEQFTKCLSANLSAKLGFSFEFFYDDMGQPSHVRINVSKSSQQQPILQIPQQAQSQVPHDSYNQGLVNSQFVENSEPHTYFSPFGSSTGLSTLNGMGSVWGNRS
ncbi:unnamed protein product [Kuraishia capsulata CBS 1993]|uniref:Stress response protein NST1 n=1 Tax=Kuraishia capsulata CBS 1993 TaxID=1382522 RepID=W6MV43_9ASCO|nr:uncharacterized protein KUCA_T00002031001 [Kuraishia capsulata CBS 1993]CDK26060.1 unnamed protein product [Kuraishia capsulata CBS 1993]